MAIRILLDHGIHQERIVFVTLLVARGGGVSVIRSAFPRVKIICGAVDDGMREAVEGYRGVANPEGEGRKLWIMQPGMGQIGMSFLPLLLPLSEDDSLKGIATIFNALFCSIESLLLRAVHLR